MCYGRAWGRVWRDLGHTDHLEGGIITALLVTSGPGCVNLGELCVAWPYRQRKDHLHSQDSGQKTGYASFSLTIQSCVFNILGFPIASAETSGPPNDNQKC